MGKIAWNLVTIPCGQVAREGTLLNSIYCSLSWEISLYGLAGLTGAVEGVFARKLAWRISPANSSMVKSRVSGHSAFLWLHGEV